MVNELAEKLKVPIFWVYDHVRIGAVGIVPLPRVETPQLIDSTKRLNHQNRQKRQSGVHGGYTTSAAPPWQGRSGSSRENLLQAQSCWCPLLDGLTP